MANNDILKFGDDASNILGQSAYAADTNRTEGVSGKARSNLQNKFQRQMSVAAAGLSQFIADYNSGDDDVVDTLSAVEYAALLLDTLSNAPLTTQPQFDNSQKAATTAFVQRALGSFSDAISIATSTVLPASYVGKVIYAGADSINIALPLLANVPFGAQITIFANSHTSIFIDTQSPDLISNGELGNSLSSLSISGWETITFIKSAAPSWFVSFGDAALNGSSLFKRSLTINGYQSFPGQLTVRWGTAYLPGTGNTASDVVVTFTEPFSNTCLFAMATSDFTTSVRPAVAISVSCPPSDRTAESIKCYGYTSGTFTNASPISWIAIGY